MANKAKKKSTAKKPAVKASAKKPAAKLKAKAPAAPPKSKAKGKVKIKARPSSGDTETTLREELAAARGELKRLAHAENILRRELAASLSEEKSAGDRVRVELEAVRLDLKTALADLEIARAEAQRHDGKAHSAARDLVQAHEAQRMAEHAATAAREQVYELKNELEKLGAELAAIKRQPGTPTPAADGGAANGS